jgi:hypothetical protein
MRLTLRAVHQGLSATPPPCQLYDMWKGEEFQTQFWYFLHALDPAVYPVTLSRVVWP